MKVNCLGLDPWLHAVATTWPSRRRSIDLIGAMVASSLLVIADRRHTLPNQSPIVLWLSTSPSYLGFDHTVVVRAALGLPKRPTN